MSKISIATPAIAQRSHLSSQLFSKPGTARDIRCSAMPQVGNQPEHVLNLAKENPWPLGYLSL